MMPLNKKRPRTKVPKIQCLVIPYVLQDNCQCTTPKKQHAKKNKEETAEYAKLLVRRIKEVREICQKPSARRCTLSSLEASACESSKIKKYLRITNINKQSDLGSRRISEHMSSIVDWVCVSFNSSERPCLEKTVPECLAGAGLVWQVLPYIQLYRPLKRPLSMQTYLSL